MRTPPETLISELTLHVGRRFVLTDRRSVRAFCLGFRCGEGTALAVVRPGTLLEFWRVLESCVAHRSIILMQAANTGLTGGSTPWGTDYDRCVVLISTLRMSGIQVIDQGRQVICLPGATLHQLEQALQPWGREPHSVIGSSCIGASVVGGICNNSGGALIRRGPAYTQLALYAQVNERGQLCIVNHLDIDLGDSPETILERLEGGHFSASDISTDSNRWASDHDYARRVRGVDVDIPARFNADQTRLHEASGSAGKVAIFAVRLDTFPRDSYTRVFYLGTNEPRMLTQLRRHILLTFRSLPVLAEYIHRPAFDIAAVYGKDTFLAIRHFGTAWLPRLFRARRLLDGIGRWIRVRHFSDRLLQLFARCAPQHLPRRMRNFRDRFEHHLILKMADDGVEEVDSYLRRRFRSEQSDFFQCSDFEARDALLHRFSVAGAAVRYRALYEASTEEIVALDFALRPNDDLWTECLPELLEPGVVHALCYGHFFCHVFHQDFIVRRGCDARALEEAILKRLDQRGAEYPAEHNVGHLYRAKTNLVRHYRALDPCNCFNPGIGRTSRNAHWREAP